MIRKAGLLGALVFAALVCPASAQGAAWLPSFVVGTPGEPRSESFAPRVAIDAGGDATVVYEDGRPQGAFGTEFRVRAQTFFADGAEGPLRALSDAGAGQAALGVAADGAAVVAWERGERIELARLDEQGEPLGAPQPVSPAGERSFEPDVAVNAQGEALVAWTNADAGAIEYVRVAPGGAVGPVLTLSEPPHPDDSVEAARVALDDEGRGFAVWRRFDSQAACCRYVAEGRTIDADDSLDPQRELSADGFFPDGLAAVIDAAGNGTAVWSPNNSGVRAARLGADGTPGDELEVSPDGYYPAVAIAADGVVTIGFELWDGSDDLVRSRQIDPGGSLAGPAATIAAGDVDLLDLAVRPDGTGFAAYSRSVGSDDGSFARAHARALDAAGAPAGPEEPVSPADGGDVYAGELELSGSGDGILGYERELAYPGAFNCCTQVEAAIHDGAPPALSAAIPGSGSPGQELVMGASAGDRSPVAFEWDFGDGQGASGALVEHSYSQPGTYLVTVTATDAAGNASSRSREIEIATGGGGDAATGACAQVQVGTPGPDALTGSALGDKIEGRGGADVIRGRGGDDCLHGQRGADVIRAGAGRDLVYGGRGRDRIFARDGQVDLVVCGRGRDRVVADRKDVLIGCERVRAR